MTDDVYAKLARPFDHTFKDTRGGATFDYITGEQCISRLNEELGYLGWSFRIVKDGIHPEADECWALGELTVVADGMAVVKQQYGSQKVKRSRSSGNPLDIGFDLKGAATDALKKCASLIGIGLYLYEKQAQAAPLPNRDGGPSDPKTQPAPGAVSPSSFGTAMRAEGVLTCEECGDELTETNFKDGTAWGPDQLAVFGRRKHSRILCMSHYRAANEAKRRAEDMMQGAAR